MCVTPVACRYFLGHAEPGGFWKRRRARIDRMAERLRQRALRARCRCAGTIISGAVALVVVAAVVAARLPSTFFPDIDESMERIYVRYAPGTSLAGGGAHDRRDRQAPGQGAAARTTSSWCWPTSARRTTPAAAMTSPNWGPYMGFIRLALTDAEHRKLTQQQIADRSRKLLDARVPRRRVPAGPGRPRRQRVRQRLPRPARRRGPRRQARGASTSRRARWPR